MYICIYVCTLYVHIIDRYNILYLDSLTAGSRDITSMFKPS